MLCHIHNGRTLQMSSRSRSRSRSRSLSPGKSSSFHRGDRPRDRDRDRNKSRSPTRYKSDVRSLPEGVERISENDYFLKSAEFSRWLRIEKRKVCCTRRHMDNNILSKKLSSILTNFVQTERVGIYPFHSCPIRPTLIALFPFSYFRKFVKVGWFATPRRRPY